MSRFRGRIRGRIALVPHAGLLAAVVLSGPGLLGGRTLADEGRYLAALNDGSRVSGPAITEWYGGDAVPKLAGKAVFDANNPFRWLLDLEQPVPGTPEAYVEFTGGDRLPGRVLTWERGTASPYEQTPDYLLVEPSVPLDDPRLGRTTWVRVAADDVRRIAWVRAGVRTYQPGTLFLRDGRQMPFRSLRWTDGAVTLLTEAGIEQFPLSDLAEIHFPTRDPWDAYFDQLATLTPAADARLIRVETADGLRVTTSTDRFDATVHGNRNQPTSWYQRLQPAWALDPFWVRFASVRSWLFFEPHRVPLSLIAPSEVRQESVFGSGWTWRLDRTVHGQTLRSGGEESPQGFGVHARNELEFELPAAARSFRARVGLDHAVGDGGCVQARVLLAGRDAPLFQSPVLIGSATAPDTGEIPIPAGEMRRLVLTVDPVATGRPPGADPFDIRDTVDWLDPVLTLDAEAVQQEIRQRTLEAIPALAGWTSQADGGVTLVHNWDETFRDDPRYRLLVAVTDPFARFSRTITVGPEDRFLCIHCAEVETKERKAPPTRVQVRIDGRAVAAFTPPKRVNNQEVRPFAVPLAEHREREVTVELVQFRTEDGKPPADGNQPTAIDWRGVATMSHRPGLLPLFDEQRQLAESLVLGDGTAEVVAGDAHLGQLALKVTPPGRGAAMVPGWQFRIRQNPRLGEYGYLAFAWKKSGGKSIALEIAHDGEFGGNELPGARPIGNPFEARRGRSDPQHIERGLERGYRFAAGPKGSKEQPEQPFERAQWIGDAAPEKWQAQTRNMAAEFGEFTLTGLNFLCPDGEAALFDAVYLARSNEDLRDAAQRRNHRKWAAELPDDSPILRRTLDPQEFTTMAAAVAPLFSCDPGGDRLELLKEYAGRQTVLQTKWDSKEASVFRAALSVPKGQSTRLRLAVSHPPKESWELNVVANGEKIHSVPIGPADEPKWHDIEVDLSRFAGQDVDLRIVAEGRGNNKTAYWHRLDVVTE